MKRAQSVLEYTLLLGAIIAVIVAVLLGNNGIKDKVKGSYEKVGAALSNTVNNMSQGMFAG